jgi:hypothetical protein
MYELLGPFSSRRRLSRRALVRVGGLAPLGLGLPDLMRAAGPGERSGGFGRAKGCLLLYLWGGPSHLDTFDLKPDAPSEVRGEFRPMSTAVPGIQVCEHFPHLARQTGKIAFVRSVTHSDNNHSTSAHWMLTGHKHPLAQENFGARRSDFPHLGSVVSRLAPGPGELPAFVALPEVIGTTAGFVTPGQDAGFLGGRHDPFRINQHPVSPDFRVRDLAPGPGIDPSRLEDRLDLRRRFDRMRAGLEEGDFDGIQGRAIDLVTSPAVREAFDLAAEGEAERERYGLQPFGQSVLLARRLLEAGVRLVTVYWHRDKPGVDTTWDTHGDNFRALRDRLIPQVDRPVANLLQDLQDRGLLDDILVVWMSEFGRTPKINRNAGRDHWGRANTVWMAGAGIPGGQVHGATDRIGSEPVADPVAPADLTATMFHLLGLDPSARIADALGREFPISEGRVLREVIG